MLLWLKNEVHLRLHAWICFGYSKSVSVPVNHNDFIKSLSCFIAALRSLEVFQCVMHYIVWLLGQLVSVQTHYSYSIVMTQTIK